MKKLILSAVLIIVGLGFWISAPLSCTAAESISQDQIMSSQEAVLLKKSLDVLGMILSQLQSKVNSNQVTGWEKISISANLWSVGNQLSVIDQMINIRTLAAKNINQPTLGNLDEQGPPLKADDEFSANGNKELASVNSSFDLKNFKWPVIVVILVIVVMLIISSLRKKPMVENNSPKNKPQPVTQIPPVQSNTQQNP
ncbi:MAG TPA: hypothetical protein PK367_02310 [Candidatus Paceibacterota bacterium]|nr:hypothetical protein [Candidatus Magasanikbacteria bacterium]HPW34570.1 hypothetical protein [Candidatus Paceibacterota bacterium]